MAQTTGKIGEFRFTKNLSVSALRSHYEEMESYRALIPRELTFTLAPSRCQKGIVYCKKNMIRWVMQRLNHVDGLAAYLLTREDTKAGWPHFHGIGWFEIDNDNSQTLFGGRLQITTEEKSGTGKVRTRSTWLMNELGKTSIDPLRFKPYDKEGKEYKDWLDYICKDQEIPWREGNVFAIKEERLSWSIRRKAVDAFVD